MLFSFYVHRFLISLTIEINNGQINKGKLLLSAEFYKFFWPEIRYLLVESLNYSYKEAIITLIEKKDRD